LICYQTEGLADFIGLETLYRSILVDIRGRIQIGIVVDADEIHSMSQLASKMINSF
jgi:hypothetical protein